MSKPKIVISAISLTEGGPLSVLRDCLIELRENWKSKYDILALVNRADLIGVDGIDYLEFPKSRKSWFFRLYYEYIAFNKLSKKLRPELWLSLHDTTPFLSDCEQAVYCHNPSPFYNPSLSEFRFDPRFGLFTFLYKYLYRINIHSNRYVIVQQQWLRREFQQQFNLKENIIVAHPAIEHLNIAQNTTSKQDSKIVFIYPCLPRVFKNLEIICQAAKILEQKGLRDFEVLLTLDGTESKYSKRLYNKYKKIASLNFIGIQTREKIFEYYSKTDALIFPSKLETWGMPITEFIQHDKPIFLSDLEYAHETAGNYNKVKFFDPENPADLAEKMYAFIQNKIVYDQTSDDKIKPPFAANWKELFEILLNTNER